jgi:hypothetical protein
MGEWRYSTTILDLGTRWRCVVNIIPRENPPWNSLGRRLSGPQNRSGYCGVKKNLLNLPGIDPLLSSSSLYRLSYPGSSNMDITIKVMICFGTCDSSSDHSFHSFINESAALCWALASSSVL